MMDDTRKSIWSELDRNSSVDLYRRNLQRTYLNRMEYLMTEDGPEPHRRIPEYTAERSLHYNVAASDVRPLVRGELKALQTKLRAARNQRINKITKYHYEDALARIEKLLDPK